MIAICDRYLTQSLRLSAPARGAKVSARRSAFRAAQTGTPAVTDSPARNQGYPWALPSASKLLDFASHSGQQIRGSLDKCIVLFFLLVTFGQLRSGERLKGVEMADSDLWFTSVANGELEKNLQLIYADEAFSQDTLQKIQQMRAILTVLLPSWCS